MIVRAWEEIRHLFRRAGHRFVYGQPWPYVEMGDGSIIVKR